MQTALGASRLYGDSLLTDVEFDDIVVACQRLEELLEILAERPAGRRGCCTRKPRLPGCGCKQWQGRAWQATAHADRIVATVGEDACAKCAPCVRARGICRHQLHASS